MYRFELTHSPLSKILGDGPRLNIYSSLTNRVLQTDKTWSVPYYQSVLTMSPITSYLPPNQLYISIGIPVIVLAFEPGKGIMKNLYIALVAFLYSTYSVNSSAAEIFSDNFETGDTAAWIASEYFPKLETTDTQYYSESLSAHSSTNIRSVLIKEFAPVSTGRIRYSWHVFADNTTTYDTAAFSLDSLLLEITGGSVTAIAAGPDASNYVPGLAIIESGNWVELAIEYDFETSLAAFYVAGINVYSVNIDLEPITGISLRADDANLYVDDVSVIHDVVEHIGPISDDLVFEYVEAHYLETLKGRPRLGSDWSTRNEFRFHFYRESDNYLAISKYDNVYILRYIETEFPSSPLGTVESFRDVITGWTAHALPQTISSISLQNALKVGDSTTATATASSNLAVTLHTDSPAYCSVANNIVRGIAPGSCGIFAIQKGDADYRAATEVVQHITIIPATRELGTPQRAETLFADDFETGNTSAWIASGYFPRLETTSAQQYSESLSAHSSSNTRSALLKEFAPISSGQIRYSWRVFVDNTTTYDTTAAAFSLGSFFTLELKWSSNGGSITAIAAGPSASSYTPDLANIISGLWYQLAIEYDYETSLAAFYFDGIKIHELKFDDLPISDIALRADDVNLYIDDVSVVHIPNPDIPNDRVFKYVQANFDEFAKGPFEEGVFEQYSYRYYRETGNYLAIDTSGVLWMFGTATNLDFVSLAPVEFFRNLINSWEKEALAQTIGKVTSDSDWKDYRPRITTATLNATTSSGVPVFYNSLTKENCKVTGNTVTFMIPGTCSMSVDADGTPTYKAAQQKTIHMTQISTVDQGGLTWLPVYPHSKNAWHRTDVSCGDREFYEHDDWRMPTRGELISLARSGALDGQGWTRSYTWSSERSRYLYYDVVELTTPDYNTPHHYPQQMDTTAYTTCVRKN
jgi:hypothetical protein